MSSANNQSGVVGSPLSSANNQSGGLVHRVQQTISREGWFFEFSKQLVGSVGSLSSANNQSGVLVLRVQGPNMRVLLHFNSSHEESEEGRPLVKFSHHVCRFYCRFICFLFVFTAVCCVEVKRLLVSKC